MSYGYSLVCRALTTQCEDQSSGFTNTMCLEAFPYIPGIRSHSASLSWSHLAYLWSSATEKITDTHLQGWSNLKKDAELLQGIWLSAAGCRPCKTAGLSRQKGRQGHSSLLSSSSSSRQATVCLSLLSDGFRLGVLLTPLTLYSHISDAHHKQGHSSTNAGPFIYL